jgi:hypothetical protein
MRHWAITFCWIIHRIYSHLSLFLLISFIPSSCHFSPRQVWKEAVPGCDVLIPLVLIDGAQGKNPPWTGTLLLDKKPWTTLAHDTLMLCKTMEIHQQRTGGEQIKGLNTSPCSELHNCILLTESGKCSAWLIFQRLRFKTSGLLRSELNFRNLIDNW